MTLAAGDGLRVYMPGAFAGCAERIRQSFAAAEPGHRLWFPPFRPTGLLAADVLAGAPADVFVSASWRYMDDLRRAGLVRTPHALARNSLAIVVAAAYAGRVTGLEDLVRPGLVVVTPQPGTDPCGRYVQDLFERAGIAGAMVAKEAGGEHVHSTGSADLPGFLDRGAAAAGVLYRSEAAAMPGAEVVRLPSPFDMSDTIVFWIGAVGRPDPAPLADRFVAHMTGPSGQQVLADEGMLPVDGGATRLARPGGCGTATGRAAR